MSVRFHELWLTSFEAWRQEYRNLKNNEVNKPKHKVMKTLPGTQPYDMSWWWRCSNEKKVGYGQMKVHIQPMKQSKKVATMEP